MAAHGFEMHQTTVAKLEGGQRPIRLNEVQALADVFGVPIGEMFGQEGYVETDVAVAHRRVLRAEASLQAARQTVAQLKEQHAAVSAALAEAESTAQGTEADLADARESHRAVLAQRDARFEEMRRKLWPEGGGNGERQ